MFEIRSRQHRRCVLVPVCICVPERRCVSSARGKIMTGENGWLVTLWRVKRHIFLAPGWAAARKFSSLSFPPFLRSLLYFPTNPFLRHHPTSPTLFKQRTKMPRVLFFFRSHTWLPALSSSVARTRSKSCDRGGRGGFKKSVFWLILNALKTKWVYSKSEVVPIFNYKISGSVYTPVKILFDIKGWKVVNTAEHLASLLHKVF